MAQNDASTWPEMSDETLRALLAAAPDVIVVIDAKGLIRYANQRIETILGYQPSAILGQPVERLLPERFSKMHIRHRQGYFREPHTRSMGIGLELVGRRADGTEIPVEVSLSPLLTPMGQAAIAIIRDVTEQRRLEEQARAAIQQSLAATESRRRLLQMIIDQMPGAVYVVHGQDARLVIANRAAAEVWGATWHIGESMADFLTMTGVRKLRADGRQLAIEDTATGRVLHTREAVRHQQEVIRQPQGAALPVLVNALPLDPDLISSAFGETPNEHVAALVVLQDVSAIKEAEHLKDEFLAIATHELRNPATLLRGYATMLAKHLTAEAEWEREAITALDDATQQLVSLTDDLLDVTRMQAGRLTLHEGIYDLVEVTRRVAHRLQLTTQTHTVTFTPVVEQALAFIDPHRIEQVLTNLIGNAIKYSPDHGAIEIRLTLDEAERAVRTDVSDHGLGIPVAQQSRIFTRFGRADNVQELGISGTGLGLYLSRELIERQGGRMWFTSVEGAGSTFSFDLPLSDDTAQSE